MKNTIIEYTYKDGGNNHVSDHAVLSGPVSQQQLNEIIASARHEDASTDYGDFIPGLVGLQDLQDSFVEPSPWRDDIDHPMHIIEDIRSTDEEPTRSMTISDFTERMKANRNWDLGYLPPFYADMIDRLPDDEEPEDPGMGPWGGM